MLFKLLPIYCVETCPHLTTGIIGTTLGVLEGAGGISELLGNRNVSEGDRSKSNYHTQAPRMRSKMVE